MIHIRDSSLMLVHLETVFFSLYSVGSDVLDFSDDEAPQKVAKVEPRATPLAPTIMTGLVGVGFPPRPFVGAMHPMYGS